jgi:putative ABC transport system permease protein
MAFFVCISTSVKASIDKALDENFVGDFVVDSGALGYVGMPHEVATQIAALPEVADVAPLRFASVRVDGTGDSVTGTTTDAFDVFGLETLEGSADLGPGEVVVLDEWARDENLAVGDRLRLDFLDSEPVEVTVAGIYDGPEANDLGRYVMSVDELAKHMADDTDSQVMVQLADGVTVDEARPAIDAITDRYGTVEVQSIDDYKDSLAEQLDGFLRLILGLLALAVIIAGLGIANTVALSVLERTRELGLLRAVGMTRRQLRSTIRAEAVIISLFGAVLGLSVGILGGWGMVTAFRDEGFDVFQVPYTTVLLMAVLSAGLGLLAALLPAWRASRLDVLAAIHAD